MRLLQVVTFFTLLPYKCYNELNIIENESQCNFIEIVDPKKSDILVVVIYRPSSSDFTDSDFNYLKKNIKEYL